MAYVDVSPMITALRSNPDHFEFTAESLHHLPSRHRFRFDRKGLVSIEAACDCASLQVSRDQEVALFEAYNEWNANYWRPLQINRQFAEHFDLPFWRRALIAVTGRLHRSLLANCREHHVAEAAKVPAE